ncbi:MAG TPA: PQQ-dependent sugar dehydrogenase [Anaerolineales bacterium]|jgi:glucose/arabinose dehydrogenase|nr:PQQ-dependent sugar dehydrogenase [Anaerolineales bacterium]
MKAFIVIALLLFTLSACTSGSSSPRVGLKLIADGFTSLVALVEPNDGSHRLFVADQTGVIWIVANSKKLDKPFLDLRSRLVKLNSFYDERGLLGLAFHPDFAKNGRFYVSYSAPLRSGLSSDEWDHTTYISEFRVSASDPNRADPASERILLAMDKPGYNYEAGHLAFGPDGYLYIATGDSVHDPSNGSGKYAQDTYSLLGKILRIDVNTKEPYAIPPDNPFVASGANGGRAEVFAYGFRNPYRFSFDVSDSGKTRLFVADVGQAMMEEVDLVESGKNYGWPIREGTTCFNSQSWSHPLDSCPLKGLTEPIISYAHAGDLSAVIGGEVYRGHALTGFNGNYIFGDWGRGNGHLFIAYPPLCGLGAWRVSEIQIDGIQGGIGQLLAIEQGEEGELYLLTKDPGLGPTGNSGRIYLLVPPETK